MVARRVLSVIAGQFSFVAFPTGCPGPQARSLRVPQILDGGQL